MKARLILTYDCPRSCSYCANQNEELISHSRGISDLSDLDDYEEVILTGGEPMLDPFTTAAVATELRNRRPHRKIYVHAAMWDDGSKYVLREVDGVTYSLHEPPVGEDLNSKKDLEMLNLFQKHVGLYSRPGSTHRLKINDNFSDKHLLGIEHYRSFHRTSIETWTPGTCALPADEHLFIWNPEPEYE